MKTEGREHRDYWLGEVFFTGGYGWGVDEELRSICLGKEEDIVPVLKGEKPMPEDYPSRQRVVLSQILEITEVRDAGTTKVRRSRDVRSKSARAVKRRAANIRQAPPRKRLPIHSTKR